MAEIIKFENGTKLDVPASTVVGDALAEDLEDAVVIGWCRNGDFYLASSHRRYADTLWVRFRQVSRQLAVGRVIGVEERL
jgi:hypothetical protein